MNIKKILTAIVIMVTVPAASFCDTKPMPATALRIDVSPSHGQDEAVARVAVNKALKEAAALDLNKVSVAYVIDRAVAVLKECGVNNAFVCLDGEMYCLGMKTDKEMWKAWIPHPTDKKKVFAILRLKDKAIATLRKGNMSASVVADDIVSAEDLAKGLLAEGPAGLKAADERGIDALIIIKDGHKLKTEMAGGFKSQYDKTKK